MTITPEIIGYVAATLTTSSFLPQAIMTIKTRDTESLSLGMYATFTLGVLLWLIYGLYLEDKAIIYANAITLILASSILFMKVYNSVTNKTGHISGKKQ
ncbi:glutathione synthetase [Methylococcaceae bacterium HT4]|nr:glutathione synthetase [Methylococcaceae bacterium HT4]TXL21071.1 glutathione synthetase [Methylococcaceae bacterium HT5]